MKINPRRPYDAEGHFDGYMESDRDYVENNLEACVAFLDAETAEFETDDFMGDHPNHVIEDRVRFWKGKEEEAARFRRMFQAEMRRREGN